MPPYFEVLWLDKQGIPYHKQSLRSTTLEEAKAEVEGSLIFSVYSGDQHKTEVIIVELDKQNWINPIHFECGKNKSRK